MEIYKYRGSGTRRVCIRECVKTRGRVPKHYYSTKDIQLDFISKNCNKHSFVIYTKVFHNICYVLKAV